MAPRIPRITILKQPVRAIALSLLTFWAARADTIALHPSADTSLFQDQPTNNLGGELTVPVGTTDGVNIPLATNRGLFKFDIAANIPAQSIITSVSLDVRVVQVPGVGRVDSTFELHRVLRDWGEGNKKSTNGVSKDGLPATAGEATWVARFSPGTFWSAPGAASPTDFTNALSATTFIGGVGAYTFTNLVADVQYWVNNPGANFGWLMRSQSEGTPLTNRRLGSREGGTNAPTLTVQFIPPPHIDGAARNGGNFTFSFLAQTGFPYTVEFRDSFSGGTWQSLTSFTAQAVLTNWFVTNSIGSNTQKFFRVKTP
jgi:hypothetical protein